MAKKQLQYSKLEFVLYLLIFFCFVYTTTTKINLTTTDLGRHIRNGQQLLNKNGDVLSQNYYSYTHPKFPFINHHWGSGIIFYLIYRLSGFQGISLFYILVNTITFFLFFKIAKTGAGPLWTTMATLIALPLISYRTEIRPEIFSYLFSGIFLFILLQLQQRQLSFRQAALFIVPLQLIWINLHIMFFLGFILISIFICANIIDCLFNYKYTGHFDISGIIPFLLLLILALISSIANPFGIKGLLMPLMIFKNYGYRIIENQPVWFIENLIHNPLYTYFKFTFGLLLISLILPVIYNKKNIGLEFILLTFAASIAAWLAVRNLTFFGYILLPVLAINAALLVNHRSSFNKSPSYIYPALLAVLIFIFALFFSPELQSLFPKIATFGIGLQHGETAAAEFFQRNKIKGPVFNNYDIGSYLIFYLFPDQRVFVDNRPEAYPESFFKNEYIPMQENEEIWRKKSKQYNFNAIFFSITDATPWGQKFLIERVRDPQWIPVFANHQAIIFLKNTANNKFLIKTYAIPTDKFIIRKN